MNPLHALLLGIVEGITEYLPISSTGHLILVSRLFGLEGAGADAFDVVIQLGAILAVVVQYRRLLWQRTTGLVRRESASFSLLLALVLGFAPTAVAGLLLRKRIKELLFGAKPVAIALVVGGIVMIVVEALRARKADKGLVGLEHVTPWRAFVIGLGQCVSMWPGSSRSMCTIVTGQLTGLSTATAAEFSFLLGLPTLGAATLYEAYKSREALAGVGALNLAIGLVVSFLVAWAVIAGFIAYLQKRGLAPFGVYRIALGVLVFIVLVRG
ncbi:MAG TPA: undecaprenyl-diphosphate phosphatase [Labilithrix sp.]|nr:undecaprenyl-diphosphate phosphatase [Labilithrix sp.]